jgi:signal transduction histidine kinase
MERFGKTPGVGLVNESALILRLREANRNLVHAALSARDSLAEAETALKNQDRFVAVLAHELRGPLAPIQLVASALGSVPACEEVPQLSQRLTRQLDHLVHLVNGLDDVTRIKSGKLVLDMQPLLLADVIHSALEMARPLAEVRRQKLTIRLPQESLRVCGDFERLVQVLFNLLSNAIKFTPLQGKISVAARRSGNFASISVQDSGPGIPPAFLPFVFDLYAQSGVPQSHSRAGSGIGLSLVRSLVELHSGTVAIGSAAPGTGCTATVVLPLSPQHHC